MKLLLPLLMLATASEAGPQTGPAPSAANQEASEPQSTQDASKALDFGIFGEIADNLNKLRDADRDALIPKCDGDDADACGRLGKLYLEPVTGYNDPAKARGYFVRSCALAANIYCNEAGKLAAAGKGGAIDNSYAFEAFTRGCGVEDNKACNNIAVMQQRGAGMEKDLPAARVRFTALCKTHDFAIACHNQGLMMARGEGGPANMEAAELLMEKACNLGNQPSCFFSPEKAVDAGD